MEKLFEEAKMLKEYSAREAFFDVKDGKIRQDAPPAKGSDGDPLTGPGPVPPDHPALAVDSARRAIFRVIALKIHI